MDWSKDEQKRRVRLDELHEIMKNKEFGLKYYKAFIEFYQVYYNISLKEDYEYAANDLMHSDRFENDLHILHKALFSLAEDQNIDVLSL